MKEYIGSIAAGLPLPFTTGTGVQINHTFVYLKAQSEDEAIGKVYKICFENYPTEKGFSGHSVTVELLESMRAKLNA